MASHYHPGAYGKAAQGQWSCCRKGKTAQGCRETGFHDRPQSAMIFPVTTSEHGYYDDDDDDDYCDDDDDMNEYSKSVPSNFCSEENSIMVKSPSLVSAGMPILVTTPSLCGLLCIVCSTDLAF